MQHIIPDKPGDGGGGGRCICGGGGGCGCGDGGGGLHPSNPEVGKNTTIAIEYNIKRVSKRTERYIDEIQSESLSKSKSLPKKILKIVPAKDEDDEKKDEVCDIDDKTCKPSESCHSTNYLELVLAIKVCFSPLSFDECKQIIDDINKNAQGADQKKKYTYRNTICFSNAKRAVSHCTHFYANAEDSELTEFLSWFDKEVYLPKPSDVKTVYLGYIPEEALIGDPENEKHQKQSDVYVLSQNGDLSGISCKASKTCPLTNWWIDSYLWHCGLTHEYNVFKSCIAVRKSGIDDDLWKSNAPNNGPCEIKKKIVTNARYKDCMREQWRVEDEPDRTVGSEPVFQRGTPMHCIQTIFKIENARKTLMMNAISDIFGQTLSYDFFLLAAGKKPLFLKMNGYAPDMESIKVKFDGIDSWSGESAKFIFNVSVDCKDNFSSAISTFVFKVEIRRSGSADDYRMHFILKDIKNDTASARTEKRFIYAHDGRVNGHAGRGSKRAGRGSKRAGRGGRFGGGSRKPKRKSLQKRKTQRRK